MERGAITFGSFNRATKLTDRALDLWARVLATVPDSRMVLKSPGLDEPRTARGSWRRSRPAASSPTASRSSGEPRATSISSAYGQIDVQLDPFPHVGGATTFDGLMQGVPCITLAGDLIPERVSASFLTTLGLDDLIARTPEQYVEIAAQLAADPARLVRERATLRARLLASPLADGQRYTRALEAVYRDLWRRWRGTGDRRQESGSSPSPRRRGCAARPVWRPRRLRRHGG